METRTPGRRGKRLIKPFCLSTITAATTATSPVCILSKYRQIFEVFLLRFGKMAGHKILGFQPQPPSTHICFSSQSQICPLLRISFCPGGTFWTFFGRICSLRKVLILPDSHFLWQHKQECCTMLLLGLCLVRFPNLYFGSIQYSWGPWLFFDSLTGVPSHVNDIFGKNTLYGIDNTEISETVLKYQISDFP